MSVLFIDWQQEIKIPPKILEKGCFTDCNLWQMQKTSDELWKVKLKMWFLFLGMLEKHR